MAEQGRIVMPTVGAAGRRGRLSSNKLKLSNKSYTVSNGKSEGRVRRRTFRSFRAKEFKAK